MTFLNTFCKVYFPCVWSLKFGFYYHWCQPVIWFQIVGELFLSIQIFWLMPVVKAAATQKGRKQGKYFHCSFRELPSQPKRIASILENEVLLPTLASASSYRNYPHSDAEEWKMVPVFTCHSRSREQLWLSSWNTLL